ncbi:hypothetical protein [Streptomyces sp. NPDC006691]|uniref:hypothetical protein n=1 Tax=Streptomyces sp. NPDC006691 TaxID=3364757 RepID=UPI0036B721D4
MMKRWKRMLTVAGAAAAAFVAQAVPAHADFTQGMNQNLRVVAAGSPCFAPESNSWGAVVRAVPCGQGNWALVRQGSYDSRGGAWYVLEWEPNYGCLVPNWTKVGSPVVVSGPCGQVTGGDYTWYAWPEGNGRYELVNGGNTSLVLDMNSNGRLQVWNANYSDNQKWFAS